MNAYRDDLRVEQKLATDNCLNALSDVTAMFIVDSAFRMGGILNAGINLVSKGSSLLSTSIKDIVTKSGVKSVTVVTETFQQSAVEGIVGASVDYGNKLVEDLYALQKDEESGDKKLSTTEYIDYYCNYNEHLKSLEITTGEELAALTSMAGTIDSQIQELS